MRLLRCAVRAAASASSCGKALTRFGELFLRQLHRRLGELHLLSRGIYIEKGSLYLSMNAAFEIRKFVFTPLEIGLSFVNVSANPALLEDRNLNACGGH